MAADMDGRGRRIEAELGPAVRGVVRGDWVARALYSSDASAYQIEPAAVVFPADSGDVATVVRYAAQNALTMVPRGAGSGLAGESLGRGIILDFSRMMNRIERIDAERGEVTVQAGVVLEVLNRELGGIGKQIGPDPASGNRATLGGMIANNSTGAHSLKYGYIGSYIRQLRVVTAAGEELTLVRGGKGEGAAGSLNDQIASLLVGKKEVLRSVWPTSPRNRSGYNLLGALGDNGEVDLCSLVAGSEGTLAIVTEATLGVVDVPAAKQVLVVNFGSVVEAARAVPRLLEAGPCACEVMDGRLLRLARSAYPQFRDVLPADVGASLVVEFDGASEADARRKSLEGQKLVDSLPAGARAVSWRAIESPQGQARVWQARKAGLPLLFRDKTAVQPVPVIEDAAVDPGQLAEYVAGVDEITARLGVPVAYYAHAGHGALHPRPYLDLRKSSDVKKMRRLAEEVFRLAWSLGGTISSEHGEGLVRVSFIREQFGDEVYGLMRRVKGVFDPENRLNPGKIINDDPDVMEKDLRFATAADAERAGRTQLIWGEGELALEIEQCNGDGQCRSVDALGAMCPIFRATGDEAASPRGKVNLMRHWLHGRLPADVVTTAEFKRVANLCINCRMCTVECPSLVNTAKLMVEARAAYVAARGLTRAEYLLTRSETMSRLGNTFAPVANLVVGTGAMRRVLEWAGGLDRRRPMPRFAWGSGVRKLRRYLRGLGPVERPVARVAYFLDLYATWNDYELARAVVDVLRHNRVEVVIPDQAGVGMPALSYGDVPLARKIARRNVRSLAAAVRDGYEIVCSEPTAALALREDYRDVLAGEEVALVAGKVREFTGYLLALAAEGRLAEDFGRLEMRLAWHQPCHYEVFGSGEAGLELLRRVPGLEIEKLPKSCCGIAGTFGFQKKGFDLSMAAGAPVLEGLRDSGAEAGVTPCSTCKMQLELATGKQVVHPAKLLARAYGLAKSGNIQPLVRGR